MKIKATPSGLSNYINRILKKYCINTDDYNSLDEHYQRLIEIRYFLNKYDKMEIELQKLKIENSKFKSKILLNQEDNNE